MNISSHIAKPSIYTFVKLIITLFLSSLIVCLFIIFAFKSETLRVMICLLETKLHIILLVITIVIALLLNIQIIRGKIINKDRIKNIIKKYRIAFDSLLLALAIIVFTLPLFQTWSTGNVNGGNSLGGILPYSDCGYYYIGAEHLLHTGTLDSWNHRRPINSCLLATRLALVKHDFRSAMIIEAILIGLSCYLATKAFSMSLGSLSGLTFFTVLYGLNRVNVAVIMSENLGLIFGSLAFAIMWYGVCKNKMWIIALGIIPLVSGLSARLGAIIVLPCLLIWAFIVFKDKRITRYISVGLIMLAMIVGFMFNFAIFKINGGERISQFQGGTALTLYGFASGGKGWRQAQRDFPEISYMDDVSMNDFVYKKTFDIIKNNPFGFFMTIIRLSAISFIGFAIQFMEMITGILPYATPIRGYLDFYLVSRLIIMLLILAIILIGFIRFFVVNRRNTKASFILAGLIGNILSIPLIFPDGFIRVFAVTFPFFAGMISIGITKWNLSIEDKIEDVVDNYRILIPTTISVILIFSAMFGPLIVRQFGQKQIPDISLYNNENNHVIARIGPGISYLDIYPESSSVRTFAPKINERDFKANLANELHPEFSKLLEPMYENINAPTTLMFVYDLLSKKGVFILTPLGFVGSEWNYIIFDVKKVFGTNDLFTMLTYKII